MLFGLIAICLIIAAIPGAVYGANRSRFKPPQRTPEVAPCDRASVSVLVPARNEAAGIGKCIAAILASEGVTLELVVMDDQSTDATAAIVSGWAKRDSRVRLERGGMLPAGWNGKQHACYRLAKAARYDHFLFLDADVRLQPDALARLIDYQTRHNLPLLSAFPRQETGTLAEKLLIPMMHVVLLGFLPLAQMRKRPDPGFAAGCGQLFLTRRQAYQQAGTHEAIKSSRHDGIQLPRAYRTAGLMTDVVDGTPLARCRMYRTAAEVVRGLLKNADEGIANIRLIVPFTILLLGAMVMPWCLAMWASWIDNWPAFSLALLPIMIGWFPRLDAAARFDQSKLGAALHPLAVLLFVLLQWFAFAMSLAGRRVAWRGRH